MFVLGIYGDVLNPVLRYQRADVSAGQWWRIASSSIVHLGVYHMLVNQLGLLLWQVLFGWRYSAALWFTLVLSTSIAGGVMLHFMSSPLEFYAGFSGVLHGLIAFSALHDSRRGRLNVFIFLGLWAKVLYEQMPAHGAHFLEAHMHAPVIVDAHLYGAIYGTGLALTIAVYRRLKGEFVAG